MPDPTQTPGGPLDRRASSRLRLHFGWSWSWGPLAIVLGLLCLVIYGRMSGLDLLRRRQQSELADQQRQTQAALAQSARLRAAAALVAAAGTQALAVRAASGALQVKVYLNPARGAVLIASALPPVGPGRAYQLWLLTPGERPRSGGTFEPGAAGAAVALVPHALHGAVGLAVSVEPVAGSAQPTGAMVLTARPAQP